MEKSGISFSFKKTRQERPVSVIKDIDGENIQEGNEERENLSVIEENQWKGTKQKEAKQALVIPLIGTNRWRLPAKQNNSESKEQSPPDDKDDAEKQAVKEILEDAARALNDDGEERVVPLLVQNKVPDGFETDDKLNVSLRPGNENIDYDQIPIDQFGKAMLRGMGWKEEKEDKNKFTKPMEVVARPKGLGLGANRKNVTEMKLVGSNDIGDKKEELVLVKGAYCVVTSGSQKHLYGQVQGTDVENSRVMVKMSLSSQTVNVSEFAIKLVTQDEHKKYSKYLNKGKADKYREKETEKQQRKENNSNSADDSDHRHKSKHYHSDSDSSQSNSKHHRSDHNKKSKDNRSRDDNRDSYSSRKSKHLLSEDYRDSDGSGSHASKKRKHKHSSKDKKSSKHRHRSRSRDRSPVVHKETFQKLWLRPHLRVRIIDERYKKGKYFKEKVTVEDIASMDCCVCRTDDGKVLEDLCQDQLETVVPRSQPSYVMIVSGKHRTQLAEVLKKDKSNAEVTVQLLSDRDVVFITEFDQICEYTGDVSTQMDF